MMKILHRDVRALRMSGSELSFLMLTQQMWLGGESSRRASSEPKKMHKKRWRAHLGSHSPHNRCSQAKYTHIIAQGGNVNVFVLIKTP